MKFKSKLAIIPIFLLAFSLPLQAATVVVEMRNNFFLPAEVTINVGDTVTWVQRGSNHDTVSYDGVWASELLRLNETFSFTFNNAGDFRYYCTPHEQVGMIGWVHVKGAANQPPTVSLTAPSNASAFLTTDTITFSATASDNGSVAKVEFFAGATLVGTDTSSPHSVTGTLPAGTHSITAKATDNAGASTTSSAVTITVDAPNTPPVVNLTAPANSATFLTTETITFSATASDNGSVAKVEFFAGATLVGTDTTSPYSLTGTLAEGAHSITAKATDNAGATTTSSAVTITVNAPNTPPMVNLTEPSNNATFQTTDIITFSATASDNDSVAKVEFFAGATLVGTDTTSPYSVTGTLLAGAHSITAKATDNAGLTTTSTAITINVQAVANQSPTVVITSPAAGVVAAPATMQVRANAFDPDGSIAQVEFFNGQTSLGVDPSAPYEIQLTELAAGIYSFTARATDNAGASTTSSAVQVNIAAQPQIANLTRNNGITTLSGNGTTGIPHILESSSTLGSWSPVATNNPVAGSVTFNHATSASTVYRIVVR